MYSVVAGLESGEVYAVDRLDCAGGNPKFEVERCAQAFTATDCGAGGVIVTCKGRHAQLLRMRLTYVLCRLHKYEFKKSNHDKSFIREESRVRGAAVTTLDQR